MKEKAPNIPMPDRAGDSECICGSGNPYSECCLPRLIRLNRAVGALEKWRGVETYAGVFQAYSDLLWEEQYRDEEQGRMAQEYEEWEEWASSLWLEGVLLDGFTLKGTPSIPAVLEGQIRGGEHMDGGRRTVEALLKSYEGLFQISTPLPEDGPGLIELKLPPFETVSCRIPRMFLPPDTEPTDLVVGRFVRLGVVSYPTHRPLVIPMLDDASNLDAAFRVLAPLFPSESESPAALELMVRFLKARGDLVLRAAIEALLPLAEDEMAGEPPLIAADGGEIRYMVSDSNAVEYNLDQSPFFEFTDPITASEQLERMSEILEDETLLLPYTGPTWRLRFLPEARNRLRPTERQRVENLIWSLARRVHPPHGVDNFEQWAKDPGLVIYLNRDEGVLIARAFLAQPLELGRFMLEREVGSFLARESEEYLTP